MDTKRWTKRKKTQFGSQDAGLSFIPVKESYRLSIMFLVLLRSFTSRRVHPSPTWFVNTCVCTLLLWATGKETYIVFMRIKTKSNAKKKLLLKKKKAHVFLNVPIFLSKCILFFWKSINYCCTLLL